jgi:hypothetical protein
MTVDLVASDASPTLARVFATIGPSPDGTAALERLRERKDIADPRFYRRLAEASLSKVHVSLSAELSDGRRIRTAGNDIGIPGLVRGPNPIHR